MATVVPLADAVADLVHDGDSGSRSALNDIRTIRR